MRSAAAVALLHVAMGYALIAGLGGHFVAPAEESLKLFDVAEPPPPPPIEEPTPLRARSDAEEGAAAPENLRARPVPVAAPKPEIAIERPPPITVAPIEGSGREADSGASDRPGPGTGAGGVGNGTGSGGSGSGTGAGLGSEARLLRGRIRHADYPRSAVLERAGGTVIARLDVGTNGRVTNCIVTRSSGHADLDSTTCRLIRQRFRFEPARDAQGRPVASVTGWQQRWWLETD